MKWRLRADFFLSIGPASEIGADVKNVGCDSSLNDSALVLMVCPTDEQGYRFGKVAILDDKQ